MSKTLRLFGSMLLVREICCRYYHNVMSRASYRNNASPWHHAPRLETRWLILPLIETSLQLCNRLSHWQRSVQVESEPQETGMYSRKRIHAEREYLSGNKHHVFAKNV